MKRYMILIFGLSVWAASLLSCHNADPASPDADTDTDTDTDSDSDTDSETNTDPILFEWIPIPGGTFMMGSPEDEGYPDEHPYHEVDIPDFEMLKTEVTLLQYTACVESGSCTEPLPDGTLPSDLEDESYVNWGVQGHDDHPINCVDWSQAIEFCAWAGGRLPSESEWEYAARSGGQDKTYPWGEEEPSCERAIINDPTDSCGSDTTWPVCSRPNGNTEQGLCDMGGSVSEWTQDCHHYGYDGAPSDGSAWETDCLGNGVIVRGGSYNCSTPPCPMTVYRSSGASENWATIRGFRCVR